MPIKPQQSINALNGLILALEKARKSRVIIYATGDRKPEKALATQVASDVIPLFKKVLKSVGNRNKITLAIYTNGGHLETPWPLVNLIREHCTEFEVVVLSKALSAGTMIALGADRVVMTPYAHLSPIDPAATIPLDNNQTKRFEIEDIIGYIDFVKEKIGITEQQSLGEIMRDLTKEITPTHLGSANRTHSLVRRLAKNLLQLHGRKVSERQAKEIVEHLTQKLFSHRHLINRKEAKEIGFEEVIEFPEKNQEKLIENLLQQYLDFMEIETDFEPAVIIGAKDKLQITLNRAAIHTTKLKFTFRSSGTLRKVPDPSGNQQIEVNFISNKWEKN